MPEAFGLALAQDGLIWLVFAAGGAGLIYGFAGFGAALFFMPVALLFVPPLTAVAAFQITALASLAVVVPQAWGQADKPAAARMLIAAVLAAPAGIWLLRHGEALWLRWAVSIVVLGTLAALIAGWRTVGKATPRREAGVGAGVGFLGGSVGLNGPVLILFQLASDAPAAQTRANTLVVLTLSSLAILPLMALQGALTGPALALGALLFGPYLLGAWGGRRLFTLARAPSYRRVAYVIIGLAGLMGLPIWN